MLDKGRNQNQEENTNDNSQSSNSSLSLNIIPNMVPIGEISALTDSESNQAAILRGSMMMDSHLKSNTSSQMDTEDDSMTK